MMLGDVTARSGLTPPGARSSRCPAPFAPTASSKGPRSRSRTSLNRGSEVSRPERFTSAPRGWSGTHRTQESVSDQEVREMDC